MQPLKTPAVVPKDTPSPAAWYSKEAVFADGSNYWRGAPTFWQLFMARGLSTRTHPRTTFRFRKQGRERSSLHRRRQYPLRFDRRRSRGVHAGYGAPELVRCLGGVNSLTDAHAFAVSGVSDSVAGPSAHWRRHSKRASRARGRSIGRSTALDRRPNHEPIQLVWHSRTSVLSPRLPEIVGVLSARSPRCTKRPGVPEWAERLHAAADATLRCSSCKGTFYSRPSNVLGATSLARRSLRQLSISGTLRLDPVRSCCKSLPVTGAALSWFRSWR